MTMMRFAAGLFFSSATLSLAAPASQPAPGPEIPEALRSCIEYRRKLTTGYIKWTSHYYERPRVISGVSRFANGDFAQEIANDTGLLQVAVDGTIEPLNRSLLRTRKGGTWECRDPTQAFVDGSISFPDPRTLGFSAREFFSSGFEELYETQGLRGQKAPIARFGERTENGHQLISVRFRIANRDFELVHTLDPKRGWSPVRIEAIFAGKPEGEARITLKKYGDVWFPQLVLLYSNQYQSGREPTAMFRVIEAKFNTKALPTALKPEIVGLDVGTHVEYQDARGPAVWDGKQAVSAEDYSRRVASGELKPGARRIAAIEKIHAQEQRAEAAGPQGGRSRIALLRASIVGPWDVYVQDFCDRSAMTPEQRRSAQNILDDCKRKADALFSQRNAKFDEAAKNSNETATVSDPKKRMESLKVGADLEAVTRNDLEAIFSKQLVPRLDGLRQSEQRQKAEKAAASAKP